MEKYYDENGRVAVLVSPGWGAGWSTWNASHQDVLLFHPKIVKLVLENRHAEITEEFMSTLGCDGVYIGGAEDLVVEWLSPETQFRIDEYDGNETLITSWDLGCTA